ncbi:hypothetical protein [Streptomyces sp. PT12]|uniref:hypothetical protein n=1 Tax=Streptomyces sp. PT12 TaxID=1510197 RepID=UPI0011BEC07A|nr:hypothetical protein [Streptomyces sp. PT12]
MKLVPDAEGITTLEHLDATPEPVTLNPGEHATLSLIWRNTVEGFGTPVEGVHLEIAPMEGDQARVLTRVPPGHRHHGRARRDRVAGVRP